ncbi:hypothetical protein GN958_ATG18836, partial [Phytophthora infestans]
KWHEHLVHVNYQDLLRMAAKNLASDIALADKKTIFCLACAQGAQSQNMQPTLRTRHQRMRSAQSSASLTRPEGQSTQPDHRRPHIQLYRTQWDVSSKAKTRAITPHTYELRPSNDVGIIFTTAIQGDAVLYALYIRNRVSTRANAGYKSPLDKLTGHTPRASHIIRFGSKCTALIQRKTARSIAKRAEKAIIVDISTTQKGYLLYCPNVDILDIQKPETASNFTGKRDSSRSVSPPAASSPAEGGQQPSRADEDLSGDNEGVPEDFGRPIPAGVLRRVFGQRRSETCRVPATTIVHRCICWTCFCTPTIRASDP